MLKQRLKLRMTSDEGFMGYTHMLFSLALFFLTVIAYPKLLPMGILEDPFLFFLSTMVVAGASLVPDLDNTKSTARSNMGFIGTGVSYFFRRFANFVYRVSHTRKDDAKPNPHRSFWHTISAGLLLYLLIFFTIKIPFKFYVPSLGTFVSVGFAFAMVWMFFFFFLGISVLDDFLLGANLNNSFLGNILALFIAFALAFLSVKEGILYNYEILPYLASFGFITHIIGDLFTPMGVPLFWPIKVRGRRWWKVRIMKLSAGGFGEKYIVAPLSALVIAVSLFAIFISFFN